VTPPLFLPRDLQVQKTDVWLSFLAKGAPAPSTPPAAAAKRNIFLGHENNLRFVSLVCPSTHSLLGRAGGL
jgi:hypothetical protein